MANDIQYKEILNVFDKYYEFKDPFVGIKARKLPNADDFNNRRQSSISKIDKWADSRIILEREANNRLEKNLKDINDAVDLSDQKV